MLVSDKKIASVVLFFNALAFLGLGIFFLVNPETDGGPLWVGVVHCVVLAFMALILRHSLIKD